VSIAIAEEWMRLHPDSKVVLLLITDGKAYVFTAADPLRYLALVVSRFVREETARTADRSYALWSVWVLERWRASGARALF